MRIEKIDENKIKVLIDDQEAKRWNVSFQSIAENTPEMQRVFWTAIRMAEKRADFSVDGAKLFVEAVQDTDMDGFGMLITRVSNDAELQAAVDNCSYKGRLRKTKMKIGPSVARRKLIYCFREFENVCAAVKEISNIYQGESVLYKYQEAFYLFLQLRFGDVPEELENILMEFGSRVKNGQYMHGRLNEYGNVMIPKKAVEVMEEYFCVQ